MKELGYGLANDVKNYVETLELRLGTAIHLVVNCVLMKCLSKLKPRIWKLVWFVLKRKMFDGACWALLWDLSLMVWWEL